MYEIGLINEKGERFTKKYDSEYLYKKDLNKFMHSKKLTIIYYGKG